jgi:hypothetical protein
MSWQGGGLHRSAMVPGPDGIYRSSDPVPVTGDWKTVVRLHRGRDLLALPVYLPEDREIAAPPVPAVDGDRAFMADTELMLREAKPGPAWPRLVAFGVIILYAAAATAVVGLAARRIQQPARRGRPGRVAGADPPLAARTAAT